MAKVIRPRRGAKVVAATESADPRTSALSDEALECHGEGHAFVRDEVLFPRGTTTMIVWKKCAHGCGCKYRREIDLMTREVLKRGIVYPKPKDGEPAYLLKDVGYAGSGHMLRADARTAFYTRLISEAEGGGAIRAA